MNVYQCNNQASSSNSTSKYNESECVLLFPASKMTILDRLKDEATQAKLITDEYGLGSSTVDDIKT